MSTRVVITTGIGKTGIGGTMVNDRLLKVGEFVPAAILTARHMSMESLADPEPIRSLYSSRMEMSRLIQDLLPVEENARQVLVQNLQSVNREITLFEQTPNFNMPTLDPSFLTWRTREGFPAFSVFPLGDHKMKLSFSPRQGGLGRLLIPDVSQVFSEEEKVHMQPLVPQIISQPYLSGVKETFKHICMAKRLSRIELSAVYRGLMPERVRENIKKWQAVPLDEPRFDEIFIIAEAPSDSWEVKEIPQADPLVVGISHGVLWLIDAYDLTPTEKFVAGLQNGFGHRN